MPIQKNPAANVVVSTETYMVIVTFLRIVGRMSKVTSYVRIHLSCKEHPMKIVCPLYQSYRHEMFNALPHGTTLDSMLVSGSAYLSLEVNESILQTYIKRLKKFKKSCWSP